jgi:hypothetical protein
MSEEDALKIHEAHEHAELAHADKTLAPVSLAMAILAVAVGALSMLGHRAHNGVLLAQTRANFQKTELVGNKTREHADVVLLDMLDVLAPANTARAVALKEEFKIEMKRYENQEGQDRAEERRLEVESQRAQRKANRFDLGELFCEMALVLSSITLLTRDRRFWFAGILAGGVGLVVALTAVLVT